MRDQTNFHAAAADIRSLLDGTDPAAGLPAVTAAARLASIRDQVLSADAAGARQRTRPWRAARQMPRHPDRRRRPRTVVAYAVIPALLAVTGAAWALTGSHQPGIALSCFSNASLRASRLALAVTQDQSPVTACAHQWAIGSMPGSHSHEVPPLVACEISYGIGVFPRTTCARLHLPALSASYLGASRNLAAFMNALDTRLPDTHRCVRERQAIPIARQLMARYGYASWHLRIKSYFDLTGTTLSPATSCAGSYVDSGHHVVELILNPGPDTAYGRFSAAFDALGKGLTCKPGSTPFDTTSLFTPRMRRLFAQAMPGWTMRVAGHRTDRAHPCYNEALDPRTKQWILTTGSSLRLGRQRSRWWAPRASARYYGDRNDSPRWN